MKFEKALKYAKNDGFEMKFSIEVSLKIFLGIQYHQYGYVKHCSGPGLYARQKIISIGHSNQKILMKTLTPSRKNRFGHSSLWTTVEESSKLSEADFEHSETMRTLRNDFFGPKKV